MRKKKEIFILYDKKTTLRETRNRYDLYMKNKPFNKSVSRKRSNFWGKHTCGRKGIYRLLRQNSLCKNNNYEYDYEFNSDFFVIVGDDSCVINTKQQATNFTI